MRSRAKERNYFSLIIWIVAIIGIGSLIGLLTKPEISTWYSTINLSPLTPPNYIFPIAWTIFYGLIGVCGWLIWSTSTYGKLKLIKRLYIVQLVLNWSWTPLFFHYHLIFSALLVLIAMSMMVGCLVYYAYRELRLVTYILSPYLIWLLFASYLNLYMWLYN